MRFFQEACGTCGSIRIRISSARLPVSADRLLDQPYAVIRRDRRRLRSRASGRPRTCAFFQVVAGRIFFVDLHHGSKRSKSSKQLRSGWMDEGELITVGAFQISAELASQPCGDGKESPDLPLNRPWNPLSQEAEPPQPLPEVGLELLLEEGVKRKRGPQRLRRALALVGTAAACPVRLFGPTVAAFHCYLLRTPAGLCVVDLRAGDGIRVNGTPCPWAFLQEGDQLEIGRFLFRVRYERADARQVDRELRQEVKALPPATRPEPADDVHLGEAGLVKSPAAATSPSVTGSLRSWLAVGESDGAVSAPVAAPRRGEGVARLLEDFELLSGLFMPIVQEFRQMQQQMLEHFDRSLNVMSRMAEVTQQSLQSNLQKQEQGLEQLEEELLDLRRSLAARSPQQAALALPAVQPSNGSKPSSGGAAAAAATDADDSMHVLIHERIAALEDASRGRLHKVIQSLLGR
jgi:hypothetical protein